jgi:molybdate/tungstate transport system permease protein
MARALSEFGAVIVIAYHPMIAPVMIYERFESYGLEYSQPVAVLLILICLALFLALRVLTANRKKRSRGNFGI